ncbi:MAG: hypothetical protein CMJ72_01385 [Planctomycetaceae bacterium]|nr:hypothetical protein [Planctomycetaceae bacterium]
MAYHQSWPLAFVFFVSFCSNFIAKAQTNEFTEGNKANKENVVEVVTLKDGSKHPSHIIETRRRWPIQEPCSERPQ